MRILFRYVFREFLVPLTYCLIGFTGIYVLFELFGSFSRISAAHLPLKTILLYFAGYLSPWFHYLAAAALMLATLYTMWNFCRHSEITAMRASGVSLLTIVKPLLLAALLLAGFVAWVNEGFMPEHAVWAKRMRTMDFKADRVERARVPRNGDSSWGRKWIVGGSDESCAHLTEVKIVCGKPEEGNEREILAEAADYLDGEWWLTEVMIDNASGRKSALRAFPELTETPSDMRLRRDAGEFSSAADKFRFAEENHDLDPESRLDLRYRAWAQLLSPLACLIVTLLSIPAGISSGRQSVFAGIVAAIAMYVAYYGLTIACLVFAKTGVIPPFLAAVLPHVIFLAIGVYFCLRPLRQTMILLFLFLFLFAIYAVIASVLQRQVKMDVFSAQVVAGTIPAFVAGIALVKLRPR